MYFASTILRLLWYDFVTVFILCFIISMNVMSPYSHLNSFM